MTSRTAVLELLGLHHLGLLSQKELGQKHFSMEGDIYCGEFWRSAASFERQRNEDDRRSMTVSLTGEGEQIISRVFPDISSG